MFYISGTLPTLRQVIRNTTILSIIQADLQTTQTMLQPLVIWLTALAAPLLSFIVWLRIRGLEYVIIHYRWIFACLFLMPLSVVYDVVFFIRNWIIFKLNSAPKKHDKRVADVQSQVIFYF